MNCSNDWGTELIWTVAQLGKMTTYINKNCSQDFSAVYKGFNLYFPND